jgi:hypothetical protein
MTVNNFSSMFPVNQMNMSTGPSSSEAEKKSEVAGELSPLPYIQGCTYGKKKYTIKDDLLFKDVQAILKGTGSKLDLCTKVYTLLSRPYTLHEIPVSSLYLRDQPQCSWRRCLSDDCDERIKAILKDCEAHLASQQALPNFSKMSMANYKVMWGHLNEAPTQWVSNGSGRLVLQEDDTYYNAKVMQPEDYPQYKVVNTTPLAETSND